MAPNPLELMEEAVSGIQSADSFSAWARNAGIGTILLSFVYAVSNGILTLGDGLFSTLGAITDGLSMFIMGTIGAGVGVVDAGGTAAETSFLEGTAAYLGPLAFPVGVGVVVIAIYIVARGYQEFSPLQWFSGFLDR
jgi:hypothetical protein